MRKLKTTLLFVIDFYDCVLSAVVLDEDCNYLYAVRKFDGLGLPLNEFLLYEIPSEKLITLLGLNELFLRYIGESDSLKPPEMRERYYNIFKPEYLSVDIKDKSPIGYCEV